MTQTRPPLVLASRSPFRRKMLADAGVAVEALAAEIDERAAEAPLLGSGASAEDVAMVLAEAKAGSVSEKRPEALVIGADQTLALDGELLHKPADMAEARRRLLLLSGKTHQLNSAVVLARGGETLWRHVSVAQMTMRTLTPDFVGRHLARVGDKVLASVGAYQVEGEGIQLFERIDGDFFAIIGLPLLPLLAALRDLDAFDG
ncbi:Maf-like protein [Nitratireductor sp. CAU 1489]|uniref:7-methyl-GTP pyrophosphatase n=1 Tax=Nitratireductor arenosus TaxID=2682096 RepID=A0A844QF43_9HYPH|nr:Maf-like protein [Nitratireductor arenosus]MVA96640.1 Maf-like protein [Nitratireductor arenosus]